MAIASIQKTISGGGISISSLISRTGDGQIGRDPILPAGKAGTLSTRTDDNTGVATLSEGHGIADADVVDVFWTNADGTYGVRYGMTVGTVAGTAVPIDGGAGDNLPAEDYAIVVTKQVEVNVAFDGDNAKVLAVHANKLAHVDFQDAGSASLLALTLAPNEAFDWADATGADRPITGNAVATVKASCGDSANDATLKIIVLEDATP